MIPVRTCRDGRSTSCKAAVRSARPFQVLFAGLLVSYLRYRGVLDNLADLGLLQDVWLVYIAKSGRRTQNFQFLDRQRNPDRTALVEAKALRHLLILRRKRTLDAA